MNFTSFPMQTFQTISFADATLSLSAFNVTYTAVNSTTYTISLLPLGYAFLNNENVTVTTEAYSGSDLYSINDRPLSNSSYQMSDNYIYTYLNPPSMTQTER